MIVSNLAARSDATHTELSATVAFERTAGDPMHFRLRFSPPVPVRLPPRADPFVALALLPAMVVGERLVIEGAVSPQLARSLDPIQSIYRRFFPWTQPIAVVPGRLPVALTGKPGDGVACFFSGGVDSFYSFLKHRAAVTHLVLVRGFDSGCNHPRVYQRIREHAARLARTTGKQLLEVEAHIRAFTDRLVKFDYYHGAMLAAVGLAAGAEFGRVLIPATFPYDGQFPWGTHLALDPLWSTESTTFEHDGCEASRLEKIVGSISRSHDALEMLRVCSKNPEGEYNCGVCEKCLRTMIALHACGRLNQSRAFARPVSLLRVMSLRFKWPYQLAMAEENLAQLGRRTAFDRALRRALALAIVRNRWMLGLKMARGRKWSNNVADPGQRSPRQRQEP